MMTIESTGTYKEIVSNGLWYVAAKVDGEWIIKETMGKKLFSEMRKVATCKLVRHIERSIEKDNACSVKYQSNMEFVL